MTRLGTSHRGHRPGRAVSADGIAPAHSLSDIPAATMRPALRRSNQPRGAAGRRSNASSPPSCGRHHAATPLHGALYYVELLVQANLLLDGDRRPPTGDTLKQADRKALIRPQPRWASTRSGKIAWDGGWGEVGG